MYISFSSYLELICKGTRFFFMNGEMQQKKIFPPQTPIHIKKKYIFAVKLLGQ